MTIFRLWRKICLQQNGELFERNFCISGVGNTNFTEVQNILLDALRQVAAQEARVRTTDPVAQG
jgi:hypothetical protein